MAIKLSDFEVGAKATGDVRLSLGVQQDRLSRLHKLAVAHGKSAIIAIEGWAQSETPSLLQALATALIPTEVRFSVNQNSASNAHFLKPFWQEMPEHGQFLLLDGSWYRRVNEAPSDDPGIGRALDEINEFEALLRDNGTLLLKFFLHVSEEAQRNRLSAAVQDAETALNLRYLDELVWRDRRIASIERILLLSDTHWAPWTVIDANNSDAAILAVMKSIADRLEAHLPTNFPERDPQIVEQVRTLLELDVLMDSK